MIGSLLRRPSAPLPFEETLYPLGFPVRISTNSELVRQAALAEWGAWIPASGEPAVNLRIEVSGTSAGLPPAAQFHAHRHLFALVADASNLALCDTRARTGVAWITSPAVEDAAYFQYHFLDPIVCLFIESLYLTPIHAACVARGNRGALLCGDSGAGKSTLAYACARRGWTYVTDDASYIRRRQEAQNRIIGNSQRIRLRPEAARIFPELAGYNAVIRGNGKPSIELWTHALQSMAARPETEVDRLIFLDRKPSGGTRLKPFAKSEALQWCEQVLFRWNPSIAAEQRAAVSTLLERSQIQTLEYSGVEAAVDALER
jgi:hypothetical protein